LTIESGEITDRKGVNQARFQFKAHNPLPGVLHGSPVRGEFPRQKAGAILKTGKAVKLLSSLQGPGWENLLGEGKGRAGRLFFKGLKLPETVRYCFGTEKKGKVI